ncbi:MAG: extracellular solute-binding protein [Clostridia bacterium]|nr:extracellular solute-binding protein [Clostridia bacterium]
MKKAVLFLLALSFVLPALLCSCHGSRGMDEFVLPGEFDTSRHFDIVFWAKNDTNKTQIDVYNKAKDAFEQAYPNVSVTIRFYTDYSVIYNDVITNISTQTTPNVCISYPDHIATYMTGDNVVVPLNALMDDPDYGLGGAEVKFDSVRREEIVPKFLEECSFGGTYYALPFMRSTEACYINKTYVEKLGYQLPDELTWDFVWEVSEKAVRKDEDGTYAVNGQNVMLPFIYKSTDNMLITVLRQKDAPYSESDGSIKIFNDTTREVLDGIASHVGTNAFSTFKISGYPGNYLNAGQCIFAIDSTAGATWMGSEAPLMDIHSEKVVEFEIAVRAIPQYDTQNPKMISQGPSLCLFNKKDPQEVLASWLFMQYLLTNETQIAYSGTEGYVPVTARAQNDAAYTEYLNYAGEPDADHYWVKLAASRLLLENIENTFVTPVFNGSASLRSAASQLVESTVKAVRRKETVDDAFYKKLYNDVNAMYHLSEHSSSRGTDEGPLSGTAVTLLVVLCAAWACIAAVFLVQRVKKSKE